MSKKKIFAIVFPCIILWIILFVSIFSYAKSYDMNKWSEIQNEYSFLPSINEVTDYKKLDCDYKQRSRFIFCSETYTLRIKYSEENYKKQKDWINKNYKFQDTVINYGDKATELDTSFVLDGFNFGMLSLDEYELDYPHSIVFVGTSDNQNEIVFIYFNDTDLDYISDSFGDFLKNECGWK